MAIWGIIIQLMWIGDIHELYIAYTGKSRIFLSSEMQFNFQKNPDTLSIARLRTSSENKAVANILYPTAIAALLNLKNRRSRKASKR
jgi:hypothetical protein